MADTYKVTIASPLSFPAPQRVRAGIEVTKAYGYEGALSDEQLEAITADEHLAIQKVNEPEAGSEEDSAPKTQRKPVARK